MDIDRALRFIAEHKQPGALVTLHADGHPQASIVVAAAVGGRLWFSVTQDRVKTRNVRNDPRVTFITGTGPWVAVEGSAVVADGPDLAERLRTYYRGAAGEHPDWDEYDQAMIADGRTILELTPARAYGVGV